MEQCMTNRFQLVTKNGMSYLCGSLNRKPYSLDVSTLLDSIEDVEKMNFYVFLHHGEPRFIFITEMKLNLYPLETDGEYSEAFVVPGALYDYETKNFVSFDGETIFYQYVIHDAGVPNILYIDYDRVAVLYTERGTNGFVFTKLSRKVKGLITHITLDDERPEVHRTRYIFLEDDGEVELLLLYDDMDIATEKHGVKFCGYVEGVYHSSRDRWYLMYHRAKLMPDETMAKKVFNDTHVGWWFTRIKAVSLTGDAVVFLMDPSGEFGNIVFVVPNSNPLCYEKCSCFKYKVQVRKNAYGERYNVIRCEWARNDFDNEISFYEVRKRKVVGE